MPFNVLTSIQFQVDTEQEANDIINAFVLPPGATVSTTASTTLDGATGTVDDGGAIQPPSETPAEVEAATATNGSPPEEPPA